ncbi:MAG: type II toxin-antitoxin system prevent-host-death family antitoxin [Acidobacteriota bacterium]|nr:type II toxin-antitoxin system prevent-host-death family antitoxin [Acidobacteriota bacterium]MDH3524679.1 type II toxin-antitoxin system prevent-host-death family antitoxin [Acidobacteriota bacterium]
MDVGAYEAKTHLPRLLARVARGERITITKHGVPVAVLAPVAPEKRSVGRTAEALKAWRRGHVLGDLALRDLIAEGRR